MSLRTRILLLVMLATLVPAVVVGGYLFSHRNDQVEEAKRNLSSLANYAAENLDGRVQATVQMLHGLSRAPDIDTGDRAACSEFLAGVLAHYPQYTGILTLTPSGDLHCDSLRLGRELNVRQRDYFKQVSATLQPAFDAVLGGLTGIAVLQVAYPVLDREGRLKYVLLASLNLSQYAQAFSASSRYRGIRTLIWNRSGVLLVHKPDDAAHGAVGTRYAESELFRFASSAATGTATELPGLEGESRVWALGAAPEVRSGGARITLGVERDELAAEANRILCTALAWLIGVSLLASAAAWYVAEAGIRRPVQRISGVAGRVGVGEVGARIGAPYPRGDLGELMAVMDRMAESVDSQRAEIESRSHDLRRSNRMLRMLSGINSAIVRIRRRQELFQETCRIVVEDGGYAMAWIGLVDRETGIEPVASAGAEPGFPAATKDRFSTREDVSTEITLAARAVREQKAMVSSEAHGQFFIAMMPLLVAGESVGVLALYAEAPDFFDEREMKLLDELAGDVSFALDHIGKAEKIEYLGSYDPLTGLANAALFQERLARQVTVAKSGKGGLAVVIVDFERFQTINDTLGREAGDELLRQFAVRLVGPAGEAGRFGHLGADHFAIAVPGVCSEVAMRRVAEYQLAQISGTPFLVGANELRVSAKLGVAMFPGDGEDSATLFRNAEAALKEAKGQGDKFLFYTHGMNERLAENLALEGMLRRAVERKEFLLYYQPTVDLESRRIVGAEALIRWQSPEGGIVPPAKFIPLLEETGLILEVGSWALRQAAADHRGWTEAGLEPPRVAVNVSPIQLRQGDFVAAVAAAISEGVVPTGIDLEITESLIMQDVEATIARLKEVRALGVQVAIDDFGTGYSSLSYLAKLPVQTLKIDRSFITAMLSEPPAMTLVQTMISLAHSLRLKVVAEGVELEEQAKLLHLLRCDRMQGYLFSKPLPLREMTALLAAERRRGPQGELPHAA